MKKLLFIAMACVLCLGLVGGAFAYFSDTETSTGNVFTAGSLDLTYDVAGGPQYNGTSVALFSIGDVKPGQTGTVVVSLHNIGTVAANHLNVKFQNLVDNENGINEPEAIVDFTPLAGELSQSILVKMWIDGGNGILDPGESYLNGGIPVALSTVIGEDVDMGPLGASSVTYLAVAWEIDPDADNIIQSDSTVCDALFTLAQN